MKTYVYRFVISFTTYTTKVQKAINYIVKKRNAQIY